jgi:DNA-binding GntR family transcriptional regulator
LESIETGRLKSGQILIERELVEQSGASRTAVRETLRHLEAQGLVRRDGHKLVVAFVTPEEAEEIYGVRAALEGYAAAACARAADDATVQSLREVVEEYLEIAQTDDIDRALRTKERIYDLIYRGGGTGVVADLMKMLSLRIRHLRTASLHLPGRLQASAREMQQLLAAIEARDPELARERAAYHVHQAATVLSVLQPVAEPEPAEPSHTS